MNQPFLALGFALPLLAAAATAQDLKVGMDAPALKIAKWVKGDPVASFQPGKVYVVEFWATWCGPCIASMPHMSKLQAEYKDKGVTMIGVTSADKRGNTLDKVEAMVASKGDGMGYTVAWDDGRSTSTSWMEAAGQGGIPCAFVVDGKGKIAFIGHPMELDGPLPAVVAGTWDAARKQMGEVTEAFLRDAEKGKAALDAFASKYPAVLPMLEQQLYQQLMEGGKVEGANLVAARLVDRAIADKDPQVLNQIAWGIVDPEVKMAKRDLDLAMKAASKAVEITKEKDGAILDTLARVWFWKQDYQKALELQKKAVAADSREEIKKSLAEYEGLVKKAGGEPKPGK